MERRKSACVMFTRIVVFESEKREKVSLEISKLDAADAAGLNLAVLEEEHGRDVADTVFCNDFGILVDVDLADNHAAVGIFLSELVDHRTELDAGTAPCSPEIEHYYFARSNSFLCCLVIEFFSHRFKCLWLMV